MVVNYIYFFLEFKIAVCKASESMSLFLSKQLLNVVFDGHWLGQRRVSLVNLTVLVDQEFLKVPLNSI